MANFLHIRIETGREGERKEERQLHFPRGEQKSPSGENAKRPETGFSFFQYSQGDNLGTPQTRTNQP